MKQPGDWHQRLAVARAECVRAFMAGEMDAFGRANEALRQLLKEGPVSEMPTADHVAHAIVAACRETGEDPIECASRPNAVRGRHYAHHALVHCFPSVRVSSIARMVGAPRPDIFHQGSLNNHVRKRASEWWNDHVYQRVIRAIGVEPAPRALPAPRKPGRPCFVPTVTPAPGGLPTDEDSRRARVARFANMVIPKVTGSKGKLYDELAEAMANTRSKQEGGA